MSAVNVLAINGSLREGSVHRALLLAARDAAPDGVEVELWEGAGSLPFFNEDDEDAPPPAVLDLRRRIAAADAVLVASPEYNGSIPGALKNALDWASRPRGSAALAGKPAAVAGASPGPFGASSGIAELRKVLWRSGARTIEESLSVARVGERLDASGAPDGELSRELAALLERLREAAVEEPSVAA